MLVICHVPVRLQAHHIGLPTSNRAQARYVQLTKTCAISARQLRNHSTCHAQMTNPFRPHTTRHRLTHGRHRAHATFTRHDANYCSPLHVSIAPAARINMPVSIPVRNGEDVRRSVCPTYLSYVRLSTCAEPSVACYWLQRAHGTTRGCVIQWRSMVVQTKDGQLASRRAARGARGSEGRPRRASKRQSTRAV